MMKAKRNVVYIGQEQHIVTQAVENRLSEAGFNVVAIPSDIDAINKSRNSTDTFLCYLDYTSPKTEIVMHYLADLCRDEHKSMCLSQEDGKRPVGGAYLCAAPRHERHRRGSRGAFGRP